MVQYKPLVVVPHPRQYLWRNPADVSPRNISGKVEYESWWRIVDRWLWLPTDILQMLQPKPPIVKDIFSKRKPHCFFDLVEGKFFAGLFFVYPASVMFFSMLIMFFSMLTMLVKPQVHHFILLLIANLYEWIWSMKYPLVMTNIAMENGPFIIDGLPVYLLVIFHGCVSHNRMVSPLDLHELTIQKSMVFTLKVVTSQEPSRGIHQQCLVSQRCHFNITGAPWQLWWKPISKSTEEW